jgi:hypothetical protein
MRSHTLKSSHSMGDGWIFLKTRHNVFFKKVLWNEPAFGRIHLAGQYLQKGPRIDFSMVDMPFCYFLITKEKNTRKRLSLHHNLSDC